MNNNGWICPQCNAVFAPFMMECQYCNKMKIDYRENKFPQENRIQDLIRLAAMQELSELEKIELQNLIRDKGKWMNQQ